MRRRKTIGSAKVHKIVRNADGTVTGTGRVKECVPGVHVRPGQKVRPANQVFSPAEMEERIEALSRLHLAALAAQPKRLPGSCWGCGRARPPAPEGGLAVLGWQSRAVYLTNGPTAAPTRHREIACPSCYRRWGWYEVQSPE